MNPSTLHLYTYCANNPVNYEDPDGHVAIARIIGGIVGGVAGGLVGRKIAKKTKAKGWKKVAIIAGCAVGGAVIGAIAGPRIVQAVKSVKKSSLISKRKLPSKIKKLKMSKRTLAKAKKAVVKKAPKLKRAVFKGKAKNTVKSMAKRVVKRTAKEAGKGAVKGAIQNKLAGKDVRKGARDGAISGVVSSVVSSGTTKGLRRLKLGVRTAGSVGAIAGNITATLSVNDEITVRGATIGATQGLLGNGFEMIETSVFGQNSSVNFVGKMMFGLAKEVPDMTLGFVDALY